MNCLKAVILLWTGIIDFNASVTAYEYDGKDIRAVYEYYCGELFKSIEVYFVDIRNNENQEVFDIVYKTPEATVGPLRHLIIPFDQSPCAEGMKRTLRKIEMPIKILESTIKQLQKENVKEMNEWIPPLAVDF